MQVLERQGQQALVFALARQSLQSAYLYAWRAPATAEDATDALPAQARPLGRVHSASITPAYAKPHAGESLYLAIADTPLPALEPGFRVVPEGAAALTPTAQRGGTPFTHGLSRPWWATPSRLYGTAVRSCRLEW